MIRCDSLKLLGDINLLQSVPEPETPSPRSVRVFADTVTIPGTVYTGGADLQFSCRVLKLDPGATINTLGPFESERLGAFADRLAFAKPRPRGGPGNRGLRGPDAGNVSILCGAVVRVGPAQNGGDVLVVASEALTTRTAIVDEYLNTYVGTLVTDYDSGSSGNHTAWLTVRALGGWGGIGQDARLA